MYWLPYSSHIYHHPSQTLCLPWISYGTQKLMLDSSKMLQKQSEAFNTFLWHIFQVYNKILLHIDILKITWYIYIHIYIYKLTSRRRKYSRWPVFKILAEIGCVSLYGNIPGKGMSLSFIPHWPCIASSLLRWGWVKIHTHTYIHTHAHAHTHTHTHIYIYIYIWGIQ